MKKIFPILFLILLTHCKSADKSESCKNATEEPISTCRAKQACRNHNTSVGLGVGFGIGANTQFGVGQRIGTDDYTNCIDRELDQQKAEANKK